MKTYMKIALIEKQFEAKQKIEGFDGYEIQLLGEGKDDFSLIDKLNKPVITVHYPMNMCGLSVVCEEKMSDYMKKCFSICRKLKAGLILHADISLNDLLKKPGVNHIFYRLSKQGVPVYIENSSTVNSDEAIDICRHINELTLISFAYPLLDTGHCLIAAQKALLKERNIFKVIRSFASRSYVIHFSDIVGSGHKDTGGIHGNNFSMNEPFMKELLDAFWKLSIIPSLVLEVEEDDYCNPVNAIELNKKIKEYLELKRSI